MVEGRKEVDMKTTLIAVTAMLIIGSGLAFQGTRAQQPGTKRTDLQRHDLSSPGREVVQVRVDFDPGYVAPNHMHPGEEIIYVLEGTLEYQIDGKAVTVKPGDVLFVPARTPHSVKNIGTGNGAELATYVVEKGKPLITLVHGEDRKAIPVSEVKGMIITSIQYTFALKDADKAESLFRELRAASIKEPGVIQFEVGRSNDEPSVFALWEVYRDKDSADAHRATEHFKRLVLNGIRPLAQQRSAATVVPINE
jgi:quercetin dioxygenase-like cupin family protein/quinol monooxygenase YgiN